MLKKLDLRGRVSSSEEGARELMESLPRRSTASVPPVDEVREIIDQVRKNGDNSLRELTRRFDHAEVDELRVPDVDVEAALRDLPPLLREALEESAESIASFHRFTRPEDTRHDRDGLMVREIWKPVERAGCHVPGGLARFPSSVLMTAIPARIAGVESIALCVSPDLDGEIPPVVLAASALAGVDDVYRVGGAQAIAAMAYGTESVRSVDVIVGPGDIYVTTAKREVAGVTGVPSSFAGPSEVVVVADETTPPEYVAIDLIAQAEHGSGGLSWLVTWSDELADRVSDSIVALMSKAERRSEIESTLSSSGCAVVVDDPVAAMTVSNSIAPEHLQIMTVDPETLVPMVRHAGAIFAGTHSPSIVGDYLAGPSHVLPVRGSARFASALGVHDFLRSQHVVTLDETALMRIAPHVAAIADAEGLDAHARSVRMRMHP